MENVIEPGEDGYEEFFKAWIANGGDITVNGYTWTAVHEDTYVKFVRKNPAGGLDLHYGEQSWPQSGRTVTKGPLDTL